MKRLEKKSKVSDVSKDLSALVHNAVMGVSMVALGATLFSGLLVKRVFGDKKPPVASHKSVRRAPLS